MLTVFSDAMNVALRRGADPLPRNDWADRFVPHSRRADEAKRNRINVQRDLPW